MTAAATIDTTTGFDPDTEPDIDIDAADSTDTVVLPAWFNAICEAIARAIIYTGYIGLGIGLRMAWNALRGVAW